jgi:hypothetical protein
MTAAAAVLVEFGHRGTFPTTGRRSMAAPDPDRWQVEARGFDGRMVFASRNLTRAQAEAERDRLFARGDIDRVAMTKEASR